MRNNGLRALLVALTLGGCEPAARIDVPVGPIRQSVTLPVGAVPAAVLQADGTLVTLPCDEATACPALPTAELSLTCAASRCELSPFTLRTGNDVVDLETVSTFQEYLGALDAVSLKRAQLTIEGLRPGNLVGPLELQWSGEEDVAGASARRLATLPRTAVGASPPEVDLALDAAEIGRLATAVAEGTRRFRVRLVGPVSMGGGALPAAQLTLSLRMVFHIDAGG